MPLRRDVSSSPWCYAANLTPPIDHDDDDDDNFDSNRSTSSYCISRLLLPSGTNFLATQVWPSSRIASHIIEKYIDPSWTVCEFGCGPGLPSLMAARRGTMRVIATDVDPLALQLVRAAAIKQGLIMTGNAEDSANDFSCSLGEDYHEQRFSTRILDLTSKDNPLPQADLYILSDVFESSAVAEGAAWNVQTILLKNRSRMSSRGDFNPKHQEHTMQAFSRVWVFAQSDRAQRDVFLTKMREWYKNNDENNLQQLDWTMNHTPDLYNELWLFDLDETMVEYN